MVGDRLYSARRLDNGHGHIEILRNTGPGAFTGAALRHRPANPTPQPNARLPFEWDTPDSQAHAARCILWDHLGHEPDTGLVDQFAHDIVARGHHTGFQIASTTIDRWLHARRPAQHAQGR